MTGGPRQQHTLEVVSVLRRAGSASRAELIAATGLSRATISGLVGELRERGIVVEAEVPREHEGPGRPPERLALGLAAGSALGVAFDHTSVQVAVADLAGRLLQEATEDLDVDRDAADALDAASRLVEDVLQRADLGREHVVGIGLGLPGPVDARSGAVGDSVILPGWTGLRPAEELEDRLGITVRVDNDANLGALGELTFGAALGTSDLVYVKVASGVGAGLVVDGRLHRGSGGIAGEFGHVRVHEDGPVCRCGRRGCLETIASAPVLLARGAAHDPAVLADGGQHIGRAMADLCTVLNPAAVVVGGDPAVVGDTLLGGMREAIERHALPAASAGVDVREGALGARAELLGALALIIRDVDRLAPALLQAA